MKITALEPVYPDIKCLKPFRTGILSHVEASTNESSKGVRLASNENPYGPSKYAVQAISNIVTDIAHYPDGSGTNLKLAIANKYKTKVHQITLGCGSDNIFSLLAHLFLDKASEAIISQYAFSGFAKAIKVAGAQCTVVSALNWGHNLPAMLEAITNNTKAIFIANPNNPTGTWLSNSVLKNFLSRVPDHILIILDEAYYEYVSKENNGDSIRWIEKHPNLIITRTFSKAYGLAGLRVGYSISSEYLADLLNRVRLPYNVNRFALIAAEIALKDTKHLKRSVDANNFEKERFMQILNAYNLKYIPSSTNFLTINFGDKAEYIYHKLLDEKIYVMPLTDYSMHDYLRVTIGRSEDIDCFIRTIKNLI